jgi:hypothetical protein
MRKYLNIITSAEIPRPISVEILGGVWEQSFSAVLEEYCSILKYCSIIYIMVFGKLGTSFFKTAVL